MTRRPHPFWHAPGGMTVDNTWIDTAVRAADSLGLVGVEEEEARIILSQVIPAALITAADRLRWECRNQRGTIRHGDGCGCEHAAARIDSYADDLTGPAR